MKRRATILLTVPLVFSPHRPTGFSTVLYCTVQYTCTVQRTYKNRETNERARCQIAFLELVLSREITQISTVGPTHGSCLSHGSGQSHECCQVKGTRNASRGTEAKAACCAKKA
jgi:hypothetical protein